MPYIGAKQLKASNLKRFSVTGSTSATHVLTWTAPNEQSLIITINGVKQHDGAYTISGSPTTITLSSALVATDEMEVIGINDIGTTITPAQNSVNTDKIVDDAVTSAKLANAISITSGNSLTIDSGATITNNGTASGFGGNNTPYFSVYMGANQSITSATWTKLQHNTVHVDSASGFDNTTNYRYTVPAGQGGKYFISVNAHGITGSGNANQVQTAIYLNGSLLVKNYGNYDLSGIYGGGAAVSALYTLSAGDYIEHYFFINGTNPFVYAGSWFSAFKLVE